VGRVEKVSCPVVGPLKSVEMKNDSVYVTLVDAARRDDVLQQLRCHFAYASAQGLHDENLCALDLAGLAVEADGEGILFTAKNDSDREQVFTFLRSQLLPER
jgi:hypothetical protein